MSDPSVLRELVIVLTATIAIVFVFQKLRLPNIVGFLLTGVIIGPHGFQLIQSVDQVENLAEIGVVLLLFTIGLEFSLETILSVQRRVVWAGLLQVVADDFGCVGSGSFTRGVGGSGSFLRISGFIEQHSHRTEDLP